MERPIRSQDAESQADTRRAEPRPIDRIEQLGALCAQFAVHTLYVFGSRAADVRDWCGGAVLAAEADGSDVDIGVRTVRKEGHEDLSLREKVRLTIELERLFEVNRVDLVTFAEADAVLALHIVRGERLYAQSDYEADEFELYVMRRAGDLWPMIEERQRHILGEAP